MAYLGIEQYNVKQLLTEMVGCSESIEVLEQTINKDNPRGYIVIQGYEPKAVETLAYLKQRYKFLGFLARSRGAKDAMFDKYGITP